jgi:hypothetical protein
MREKAGRKYLTAARSGSTKQLVIPFTLQIFNVTREAAKRFLLLPLAVKHSVSRCKSQ